MIVLVLLAQALATPAPAREHARRVEVRGVENVGLVAPGIYRGSAPDAKGLDALKALGLKTVVNLRHYHGASEERRCKERGLDYVSIILESSDAPSDEIDVQGWPLADARAEMQAFGFYPGWRDLWHWVAGFAGRPR